MEEIDLYSIILDGLIDVLHLHGVKKVAIPNDLTLSIANKCLDAVRASEHNSDYAKCLESLSKEIYGNDPNQVYSREEIINLVRKHFATKEQHENN